VGVLLDLFMIFSWTCQNFIIISYLLIFIKKKKNGSFLIQKSVILCRYDYSGYGQSSGKVWWKFEIFCLQNYLVRNLCGAVEI
jgi:hypothetical protein